MNAEKPLRNVAVLHKGCVACGADVSGKPPSAAVLVTLWMFLDEDTFTPNKLAKALCKKHRAQLASMVRRS